MQEQLKQMENPLVEMEQVKREGDIAIAQGNLSLKASELQEKQRQFNVKTENQVGLELANYQQSQQKLDSEAQAQSKQLALKLTELELQFNQQLDKEVADNVLVFDPATGDFSNASR
jgi:ribosomal protein L10